MKRLQFAAANRSKRANEEEGVRVKIFAFESQKKRLKPNAEDAKCGAEAEDAKCGAEGCGKGNIGQFESMNPVVMHHHCCTNKHKVLDSAQLCFCFCVTHCVHKTSVTTEKYIVFNWRTES